MLHLQVFCNVTVTVKELPYQAVLKAASVRLAGVTDEQFISFDERVSRVENITPLSVVWVVVIRRSQ